MKKFVLFFGIISIGILYLVYKAFEPELLPEVKIATKEIVLRFGYNIPKESVLHQAAERFAQSVKQKTNGKVIVELYPNQALGNDYQMLELARLGELDIVLIPTAKMSAAIPAMQYADLPFYFPSREDVYALLDGEVGRILLDKLSAIDLVGVSVWDNGFKHFTANTPLLTPDDFNGKKIRVMKSRILMEQFRLLGADPVAIDFHATKEALKDNAVDGQENPLVAIYTMGFHLAQKHMTLSEHAFMGYIFGISAKTYQSLPMEYRDILIETALEVTPWEREQTKLKEKELLAKIAESSIKIDTLSKEQQDRFQHLMQNIPKKFESIIGSDIISKSQEFLYKKYQNPKNEVVLGFDADLSLEVGKAGLALKRGAELAIDEINAKGGLLGKKVVLVAKDNRAIASRGVENVRDLLEFENLIGLLGGIHSAIVFEEIKLFQEKQIPLMLGWSSHSGLTKVNGETNNVFRVSANSLYASEFLIEHALTRSDKIAVLYENSVWGRSNFENMERFLAQHDKKLEGIAFNRGELDFSKKIASIYEDGAEILVIVSNPKESSAILLEMAKQKNPLPIVSHWGLVGGELFEQTKAVLPLLDLCFIQTFIYNDFVSKKAKNLLAKYEQTYDFLDEDYENLSFAVLQSYDSVQLLFQAIQDANSFEYPKVIQALEAIKTYDGALKRYINPFKQGVHEAFSKEDYRMAKYSEDGKIIPLHGGNK
ncbi:MAG: DctP family TRAP transporter solute-binding subunit [Sulfurimonadaceae bacterium]|jgi:tripartite ATP-independent transporter DctP family solute receptor|nr:DctP family TRAP transporter solute-binding subunit [Sulfurimonadaceae bacterium]